MNKTSLGDRMKRYERSTKAYLTPRTPTIIRIDGKAFHTWTRGLKKPFDVDFYQWMNLTTEYLLNNIQGAVFGYAQSDEISLLLQDYYQLETAAWFDGNIQKITSVSASMATAQFNHLASEYVNVRGPAMFDARVFNLSKEEVVNYFIWRQQDFTRNSVQMVARYHLGHKGVDHLNRTEMMTALEALDPPVVWDELDNVFKYGHAVTMEGNHWNNTPVFTSDRNFVDKHVYVEEA